MTNETVVRALRHYIVVLEADLEEERRGQARPYVLDAIRNELHTAKSGVTPQYNVTTSVVQWKEEIETDG